VYAFVDVSTAWSKICTLKNAFTGGVTEADCTMLGKCASQSGDCVSQPDGTARWVPPPSSSPSAGGRVYIGPEISQYPTSEMECQLQNGKKYKCFNTYPLRAVAADPLVNYKVYVAYTANSAAAPYARGIYFTRSTGGSNWGNFTQPVLIAQDATNIFYYDPQITVDTDGTVIVSYNAFATAPGDTSGNGTFFISISGDGGATFLPWAPAGLNNWNTSTMPYHCGRGVYFVGEYRDSNAFGNRAYVSFQSGGSTTSPYAYGTGWMNRWNIE
jgi:hypothetical protein